jgi:endonuclease III related protein
MNSEAQEGNTTDSTTDQLVRFYEAMNDHFGDLHWWPGDSTLEIIIGAVLTQNTSWRNVERAIHNLKNAQLIHIEKIVQTDSGLLEGLLRPAGFFRVKAERLTNLLNFILTEYAGDFDRMFTEDLWFLRKKLLQVKGIGQETADCILLYGGGKPVFVVDAYTRRVLTRHGLMPNKMSSYREIQELFMNHLPGDGVLFGQFHALFVEVGKAFCRKAPDCRACPLGQFMV